MRQIDLLEILRSEDVRRWNRWRRDNPDRQVRLGNICLKNRVLDRIDLHNVKLDGADVWDCHLERADLRGVSLKGANFYGSSLFAAKCEHADLRKAYFGRAYLPRCRLDYADLREADLDSADLSFASLRHADLRDARLIGTNLANSTLDDADLRDAQLENAVLVGSSLRGTDLRRCDVYGAAIWDVVTNKATKQRGIFTDSVKRGEARDAFSGVVVDDIKVAHFMGLIEETKTISDIIDATTNRIVLLLGRFTKESRRTINLMSDRLRSLGYLPVVFDFPPPKERDATETVKVLASLSGFVIVDLSSPKSAPLELHAIVPHLMVPVVPIIKAGQDLFSMFYDLRKKYPWVLAPKKYRGRKELLEYLEEAIIRPANAKRAALRRRRKAAIGNPTSMADT